MWKEKLRSSRTKQLKYRWTHKSSKIQHTIFGMKLLAISYRLGKSILVGDNVNLEQTVWNDVVALAYQGKDMVFRFIMQYSTLMDFGP
jgi:hypothetical protein